MPRKLLYEKCEECGGAGVIPHCVAIEVEAPLVRDERGRVVCPCCGGRRYLPIDLTANDVATIIRERDELRQRVAELERMR